MRPDSGETAQNRVLILEDEPLIAMLLEDYLAQAGYDVVAVASTVEEAGSCVDSLQFDLAIVDVNMQGRQTFAIAERLIAKGVPFMFATGYGSHALPETFRSLPVLNKPFTEEDLLGALEKLRTSA